MASITHFCHEHPLILLKQLPPKETENPLPCYACKKSVLYASEVYGCEMCKSFLLHKSCAEHPMEIVHKSHEQHSLFILSEPPAKYKRYYFCELCKQSKKLGQFFYHCYLCDFNLDIECAFKEEESLVSCGNDLTLYHPGHRKHKLKLQPRPSSFLCDACEVEDKDLSYYCTPCNYWIHRRCAMLPRKNCLHIHAHPLTLSFGLPSQYARPFIFHCYICAVELLSDHKIWIYYCELCRYFIHIKCMEIKKPQIEVDLKGLQLDDMPRLPMSDKSVELIQRFLLKNKSLGNVEHDISLFSHKHPLISSNDEQILKDGNEDGDEVLCDGCIDPIVSPPYYHCAECRYFLHLPCAELPHELQHPDHPHPLILSSKTRFYDEFMCNRCKRQSNGLLFCCTAEGCNFNLDVKCASLPGHVEHETHSHPLFQNRSGPLFQNRSDNIFFPFCRACGYASSWYAIPFKCHHCSYFLHVSCLLLPKTLKSRFDNKHRLTLRYPPHSYNPRPFDCAECENEIDPNYWLYHCEECELSLHVRCIHGLSRQWNNGRKYGQKHQISSHPHPLRYVYTASVKSPCHSCGTFTDLPFSECETCNFHICKQCLKKIEPSSSTR